jgi:glycosyltransferase involved in cell wall biosynthesis/ADP-heptose:LPS heptosyltransferase/predicted O-methyltransferase YrrM/Tfp pilus assembly protein PilF
MSQQDIALPAHPAARPAKAPTPGSPRFSFVTIVLNGMPFLEHALNAVYEFAHEIVIVEGAVKGCRFAANPDGSSVDGTVECIRRFPDPLKKIRFLQGVWPEKCEMQNAALTQVTGDYVWLMDSDEIYRREDLNKVAAMVQRDLSITQLNFIPDNFWKGFEHLMISPYFFDPEAHYRRVFKFQPGAVFTTHRPPTLMWPGATRSTEQMNCIRGEITRAMGVIPFHYSYVLESQVAQKIELYNRYGWGKGWNLDMNQWFRECWQAWTPENSDQIERCWPVWTGGKDSRTVPFTGTHPEVMKEYIATFRRPVPPPAAAQPDIAADSIHAIIGSRNYLEKTLAAWQHIQLDAPVKTRFHKISEAIATGRPFWNNHVAFAFLADRLKPTTFLEVGVRIGASMVQVLTHAPIKVAAGVDLWTGDYSGLPNTKEFLLSQLERHRAATGGTYQLHMLHGDSHKILKDLIQQQSFFNLINVDGDHSAEGAREDLEDALQLLTPRGAILFDDIIHPAHRYLLKVIQDFVRRHPELSLLLNTHDDNGVAILLRGVSIRELLPEAGPLVADAQPATKTPAAAKSLKVAGDYAHEKDLTQIDGESEFARAIRKFFKIHQPRRIVETGTYLGTGTTRVITETLRDLGIRNAIFHSIEINPQHFALAQTNLRAAGLDTFVHLQRGLSVPRALLPTIAQIEEQTVSQPEFSDIFVDHREAQRAKLYYAETNFSGCPDDLLGQILGRFDNRPDFVLLDSGGHMGYVEFQYLIQKLAGPCLIALDDIHHIKHHKSLQVMRRDPRFEILVESQEKFGFCIARFTPPVVEPAPLHSERLLWVRTDSIGDAVLASAMLEPLRQKYPQAKLAVLCQQHVADLYLACPFVDTIICFDLAQLGQPGGCDQIVAEITAFNPDLILNSTRSRDRLSDELTLKFQAARHVAIEGDLNNISAADRERSQAKYERLIPMSSGPVTELARHAEFLRGLGVPAGPLQPVVWTSPEEELLAEAFFQQHQLDPARTIAVFPGAQCDIRVYPGYAEALQGLEGFRFLIFGVAGEAPLAQALEDRLPGRTINLCGRAKLRETVALLRRCRLYVGAESGGAHIACAVGVPNVVVLGGGHFGRFMPYSPLTTAAVLPLACFGCNWYCRYESAHCIASLSPKVLQTAIAAALKGSQPRPLIVAQENGYARKNPGLPPALSAKLAPEAADYTIAAANPPKVDAFRGLITMLDQGDPTARQLGIHLRTVSWQYDGLENYQAERAGAAEAAVAVLLNQLAPEYLQQLGLIPELDGVIALALGLAAEVRKDWRKAWELYSHAVSSSGGGITGFRLALRLEHIAASGGDARTAESVRQTLIPKMRASLPANLDAAIEEKAIANWPALAGNFSGIDQPQPAQTPARQSSTPLVTAIVSTYKSERFLRGCLEDLETQTIADQLEIIVVDSHSPQNERAIVEEFQQRYSNIVYLRTQERETVYGAWNRGARAARGRYLTNANTDDRHRHDALEILARTLSDNPGVSLVYADCLITPNENETYVTAHPTGVFHWLDFNAQDLWTKGCFAGPQPMWRREVHAEHGYFDAAMISAGDYEFWLRLAQNRTFLKVHQVLGLYLESPASVEHANREAGAKEVEIARNRYRDCIMNGQPPFRPELPEATVPIEIQTNSGQHPISPAPALVAKPVPAVARMGQLSEARALFEQKDWAAAWAATLTAIARRPFHPEAFLLLAQIANAAGDGQSAKRCAQRARELAPDWEAPKQFLNQPRKGHAKFDWLQASAWAVPATPRLSVCLIVKNEEQFLPQCLKSIRGLAAEVIVVDTGSTDRTVEIAREFGAGIYSLAWSDDFSAARNAALEHATGDWILILDADEELPESQHAKLRKDMEGASVVGVRLPLANAGGEDEGFSYVPRLFRNLPGAHFTGRIHEQLFNSLLANAKQWGHKTTLGTAELRHHGYTQALVHDRDKIARNLRLLRVAIEEAPTDVNLLMNLGLELVRSGELAAGIEKYREAYELMAAQPVQKVVPELREVLLTQFMTQLYKVKAYDEVVRVLNSPLAKHGELTASLHLALGLAHFELKQFSEAAEHMRQCVARRRQRALTPINTDTLTAMPHHCLALCQLQLGHPAEAEQAFKAALAEKGHQEKAQLDYAKFLRDQNRPVEALQQLHGLITSQPQMAAAWRLGGEISLSQVNFLEFALDWTGEALKALPEDPVAATQRAMALMLGGHALAAAPLWEKLWRSEPQPRTLAALILCEIAAGHPAQTLNAGHDEQATSLAFVEWYQKLIAAGAKPMLESLNARLEPLAKILPAAAQMLNAALTEAEAPLAV